MIIHFICRGNVLRSLIAETYLKSLRLPGVTTLLSGTIANESRAENTRQGYMHSTRTLLAQHGLSAFTKPVAEQLTQERLSTYQLVICLNAAAYEEAAAIATLPTTTLVWDVTDIGEHGRIAKDATERHAYEEDIYREIMTKIDELVASKQLADT